MRLFTGIAVDWQLFGAAAPSLREFASVQGMRFTQPGNLHVTLKFIGSQPDEQIPAITSALAAVKASAFEIKVRGLGFFPSRGPASVFWAGAEGGHALPALAQAIEDALVTLGIARETRPFHPHITLARAGRSAKPTSARTLPASAGTEFGSFLAREFHLYESRPVAGGSEYRKLASYALQNPVH